MESIPIDLVLEILLRLPSKSIERFRCLSKLWKSLLHLQYFTELFLTRSSACPRLLFAIEQNGKCYFYSSPQLQNPNEKSSLVTADFHTKFSGTPCRYDSGLIFVRDIYMRNGHKHAHMICNPNTGQYVKLPQGCLQSSYIGFDPIDRQFKVLSMASRFFEERNNHKILTLGTGKLRWRKIQCPPSHGFPFQNKCINGILYYLSTAKDGMYHSVVCFDVRSEKFKLIDGDYRECFLDFITQFVNYKGKLGLIFCRDDDEEDAHELRVWVLEDVEKHVWSKYVYTLPKIQLCDPPYVSVVGVTAMGQIVLSMESISKKPFYVFYFNPEDKTLHCVEIQGFEFGCSVGVRTYVEHVEDLKVSDAKLFGSSNSVPSVKNKTTTSRRGKRKRWCN